MNPPTSVHQVIAMNFAMLLNTALQRNRPELMALVEPGVSVPQRPDFLPRADVAVVKLPAEYISYAPRFYLTAEILSASNTQEYIARKMLRYSEQPDNLHALVISQRRMRVELHSRSNAWKPTMVTSPDDALELPEFGFRCLLGDLYRGTPLA
jgi:Uma2 family endonuclease